MSFVYIGLLETGPNGIREPLYDPWYGREASTELRWRLDPFGCEVAERLTYRFSMGHVMTHAAVFSGPRGGPVLWTTDIPVPTRVGPGDQIVIKPGDLYYIWHRTSGEEEGRG